MLFRVRVCELDLETESENEAFASIILRPGPGLDWKILPEGRRNAQSMHGWAVTMTTAWPSGVIMLPLEKWKAKFSLPVNENWWRTTGKSELSNDHHTSNYYVLQTSLQRKGHISYWSW